MSERSSKNIKRLEDKKGFVQTRVTEIGRSEKNLNQWKHRIVKWYELYKMHQSNRHYAGLANLFVPEILRAVETVVSNLYRAIAGQTPWFEYRGREKFDEPSATAMTNLVRYQMDENRFKSKLMDSLRQLAITGLTVRKVLWDFRQLRRTKKVAEIREDEDPITGNVFKKKDVKTKDELETVRDVWTFEPVDLLTFHISDITIAYDDIQKANWVGEQYLVEKQWIQERVKKGWLASDELDKLEAGNENLGVGAPVSDAFHFSNRRSQVSGFDTFNNQNTKGKIEIIERWGLLKAKMVHTKDELDELDLEPDDLVETVVIIGNRRAILKLEANPFWHGQKPYLSAPYVAQEHEIAGIGVAQIGETLQEELNDTRNQVMDNKTLVLSTMWIKSRGAGIKNKDLRIRPNGVITATDVNGLQPLRPPIIAGVGVNIEGVIKNDLRESVGAPSNLQGIAQGGSSTATESSILNREAQGRITQVAEMYGLLVLKPMLIMAEFMNYQFYDRVKAIKIIGEKGVKFKELQPSEIVGNKDVVLSLAGDSEDSPAVKRQQGIQFFTILQQLQPEAIQFHWGILNKLYKMFFPHGDLSDIYEPPVNQLDLNDPDEEIDLILGETPVEAKVGQNHDLHIQTLETNFEAMKLALNDTQSRLFQEAILSHESLKEQEAVQQLKAHQEELQSVVEGPQPAQPTRNGASPNRGQTPNTSPFTGRQSTTQAQVIRDTRVGG